MDKKRVCPTCKTMLGFKGAKILAENKKTWTGIMMFEDDTPLSFYPTTASYNQAEKILRDCMVAGKRVKREVRIEEL